ncbi:hypothetical protein C8Q76DRAFT_791135 [Earliella scabrosa]|nr:hypothetical protein C8Q76DRAFT_791135 [Earliella scabrosa]
MFGFSTTVWMACLAFLMSPFFIPANPHTAAPALASESSIVFLILAILALESLCVIVRTVVSGCICVISTIAKLFRLLSRGISALRSHQDTFHAVSQRIYSATRATVTLTVGHLGIVLGRLMSGIATGIQSFVIWSAPVLVWTLAAPFFGTVWVAMAASELARVYCDTLYRLWVASFGDAFSRVGKVAPIEACTPRFQGELIKRTDALEVALQQSRRSQVLGLVLVHIAPNPIFFEIYTTSDLVSAYAHTYYRVQALSGAISVDLSNNAVSVFVAGAVHSTSTPGTPVNICDASSAPCIEDSITSLISHFDDDDSSMEPSSPAASTFFDFSQSSDDFEDDLTFSGGSYCASKISMLPLSIPIQVDLLSDGDTSSNFAIDYLSTTTCHSTPSTPLKRRVAAFLSPPAAATAAPVKQASTRKQVIAKVSGWMRKLRVKKQKRVTSF